MRTAPKGLNCFLMQSLILDTGVLGQVTNPRADGERPPVRWMMQHLSSGSRVVVPEIVDYELRRELIRGDLRQSIMRLDAFIASVVYLPLTTEAMRLAAEFWAEARNRGRPTAPDLALDGDVILAAQARLYADTVSPAVIATTNVRHLANYVDAQHWERIGVEP